MAALAESIASRGLQAVDDHGQDWLDKGLASARAGVARRTSKVDEDMAAAVAAGGAPTLEQRAERVALELAPVGLDALDGVAPALFRWGRDKVAAFLIRWPDDKERARLLLLAKGLTVEQYLAVSDASTAKTGAATEQHEADVQAIERALEKAGPAALRIALPFVLAAL